MTALPQPGPRINIRAKGQRGEREVVKLVQAVVDRVLALHPEIPNVTLQRNQLQSHLGGNDLHGLKGFSIEVKFQENENVGAWWRQCLNQSGEGEVPVLFYRCSRAPWTVKFRAYVSTPKDVDQIEMDMTCTVDEWVEWFASAIEERVTHGLPLS